MKILSNKNHKKPTNRIAAAENYGWVVDDNEAWEAYEMACDTYGQEYVDHEIVETLSTSELASSLAYLFRMWDFRKWDERND